MDRAEDTNRKITGDAASKGVIPLRTATVFLWDANPFRVALVVTMLAASGLRVREIKTPSEIDAVHSPGQNVGLVALGASQSQQVISATATRALSANGFKVISYEDGIFSLPIATRCEALLSGSCLLLDSSSSVFPRDLPDALTDILETEAKEHLDEQELKRTIKGFGIVGESAQMMSIFRWIVRMGTVSDFSVLITGETGTGKELIAKAIHQLDPKRRRGPFIVANCGAISSGLAESEFFGHRRGAFTGADTERKGLFRSANGGVLFLDEVSELTDSLQAKLLRVLQEKHVLALGYDHEVPIDVRVIAATNRSLQEMVEQGRFREDLYHRLNILSVDLPPLRERKDDLRPLVQHFLEKYSSLTDRRVEQINSDFVEALTHLELPGNARQLENIVRSALLNKVAGSPLGLSDLPAPFLQELIQMNRSAKDMASPATRSDSEIEFEFASDFLDILERHSWNLPKCIEFCERSLLRCALESAHGNRSRTARLVGLTTRSIYNKLHKYNLTT